MTALGRRSSRAAVLVRARRGRRIRRTAWSVTALALLSGVLVLLPTPSLAVEREMVVETATPDLATLPVEDAPLADVPAAVLESVGETVASATREPERQVARVEDEAPFSMVGVGFEGGHDEPALLRVLLPDGSWSEWKALEVGGHEGEGHVEQPAEAEDEDGHARVPNSEPVWVDEAVGYEVDLPADATDVQVHLVREGEAQVVVEATEDAADAAIGPAAGQPTIQPRSSWGAAPYRGTPDYASTLSRAVVHHTVNANGYSQGAVPSIIRGIQAYHQDGNGWSDIGYNFVVDRFGTIWEGRAGGANRPVIGAHAANANTGSVGAAVLGDFTSASPPEVVINRLQTLIGWKLALHGTTPNAGNVLGHRQAGTTATSCPGQRLFDRMGDIRFGALLYFNLISDPCYGSSYEPFCDVSPQHPFASEILWVADEGIADGYADGTFRSTANVSRQAMAAFLYRLAGSPASSPPGVPSFSDVGVGHQFRDEIEWLVDQEIAEGYDDGRFRPLAGISRQAMSAFMYRYAGSPAYVPPEAPDSPAFSDTAFGRPFFLEIHWLDAEGISEGYSDGTFRPDANVTRQAMAAFLQRLSELPT